MIWEPLFFDIGGPSGGEKNLPESMLILAVVGPWGKGLIQIKPSPLWVEHVPAGCAATAGCWGAVRYCTIGNAGGILESRMSSASKAADYSVVERLRDGSGIEIRAIRPADDQEMLEAIGRTSVQSLQRRFFVPKLHFSDKELDFFIHNVDFKDHVALVAELNENRSRVIVGGGRYIMVKPGQAEMAFMVIDAYQGKGIGSVLMRHLIAIARDGGLKELIAEVLPENAPMLKLFGRFGFRTVARDEVKHLALQLA